MRVLMVSTDRKIFEPGSEVQLRMIDYAGLFECLEIIVFSPKNGKYQDLALAPNCRVYPTTSSSPLLYVYNAAKIGQRIIGSGKGWVVTCQDPFETGLVGWWLRLRLGVHLNLQIHTDLFSPFFINESWKNKIRTTIAKWLLPKADCIRVVSNRIKNSLAGFSLKQTPMVLPIYCPKQVVTDEKYLGNAYPQFDFILLMASRLTREKRYDLVIEALSQTCLATDKKIGLVIVGDGPMRGMIEELVSKNNLKDKVFIESWSNNLANYYDSAGLFILSSNYEGYGRTLIEAGNAGCPILTTNIGAVGEIFDETNCLVCPVSDVSCLSQKIIWAAENQAELLLLAEKASKDIGDKTTNKENYLRSYQESLETCSRCDE